MSTVSPIRGVTNDALLDLLQQAKQRQQLPDHSEPTLPSMASASSGDSHEQLRDTVLFLVQQQKLRHDELVDVVRDLAHAVSGVSSDVQHIRRLQGAPQNLDTSAPLPFPSFDERPRAADVAGSEVGFPGSYSATQTMWARTHGSPLAFEREEQLVTALRRVDALEREVDNLRLQLRSRDETIRRLTDAGLRGILTKGGGGSHSTDLSSPSPNTGTAGPSRGSPSSVVDSFLSGRWGTPTLVSDPKRGQSPSTTRTAQGSPATHFGAVSTPPRIQAPSGGGGYPASPYAPR